MNSLLRISGIILIMLGLYLAISGFSTYRSIMEDGYKQVNEAGSRARNNDIAHQVAAATGTAIGLAIAAWIVERMAIIGIIILVVGFVTYLVGTARHNKKKRLTSQQQHINQLSGKS